MTISETARGHTHTHFSALCHSMYRAAAGTQPGFTLRPHYSVIRVQGSLEACADFIEVKSKVRTWNVSKSHMSVLNT